MQRAKAAIRRKECLDALRASGLSVTQWCKNNGMNRTTVYSWLYQERKQKAANTESSINEERESNPQSSTIKWLSVTERGEANQSETNASDKEKQHVEMRVEIGRFIIVAPDGFKRETFKSICESILDIRC